VQDSDSETSPSAVVFTSGSFEKNGNGNGNGAAAGTGTIAAGGAKKSAIKTSSSGESGPRPTATPPQATIGDSSSVKPHGAGGALGDLVIPSAVSSDARTGQ
jgi:hypothetical protein